MAARLHPDEELAAIPTHVLQEQAVGSERSQETASRTLNHTVAVGLRERPRNVGWGGSETRIRPRPAQPNDASGLPWSTDDLTSATQLDWWTLTRAFEIP